MIKKMVVLVFCVSLLTGCAGTLHYKNKKGLGADATASDIKTSKGTIENAKGKVKFGSNLDIWIHWPWKMKFQK